MNWRDDDTLLDTTKVCRIVNEANLDVRDILLSSEHCTKGDRDYWLMRYVSSELVTLEDMMTDEIPRKTINKMLKKRYGNMPGFKVK